MPTDAHNPLGLRLPEQTDETGTTLFRAKDIEEWIGTLPVASGEASGKRLLSTLRDINHTRLPPQIRLQGADLLAGPIGLAITTLESRFDNTTFPLTEKSRRNAQLCISLSEALSVAYKIVVHDVAMGHIGTGERKMLFVALFRAVHFLARVVYQAGLVYSSCPSFTWREMHNLFAFAHANNWSGVSVKITSGGGSAATTLRQVYVKTLLFSLASPYRLRQAEIKTLWRLLPDWTAAVMIDSPSGSAAHDSRFIIDLKSDDPPRHSALAARREPSAALAIDTRELILKLKKTFDELPPDTLGTHPANRPVTLSRSTLRRLIQSWGTLPTRQFVRTQLNFQLRLVVGLAATHARIMGDSAAQTGRGDGAGEDGNNAATTLEAAYTFPPDLLGGDSELTLIPIEDDDGMLIHGHDRFATVTEKETTPTEPIWPRGNEKKADKIATLTTLNESAGGYCIDWRADDLPGVKIGELIGIQCPDDPAVYSLNVIRWMRSQPNEGLLVGLQLLAPRAHAVLAEDVDAPDPTSSKCLLVPEHKSAGRPASLFTPVLPFTVESRLRIRQEHEKRTIRLVRLLESSGAYARFQFVYE